MDDIYSFELNNEQFLKIVSGKKTVQLAINTPKRRKYAIGNKIVFLRKLAEGEELGDTEKTTISAVIENLYYFGNIVEAVETLGKETCGFKPSDTVEKASDKFLTGEKYEQVEKNGIVAIVFKPEE